MITVRPPKKEVCCSLRAGCVRRWPRADDHAEVHTVCIGSLSALPVRPYFSQTVYPGQEYLWGVLEEGFRRNGYGNLKDDDEMCQVVCVYSDERKIDVYPAGHGGTGFSQSISSFISSPTLPPKVGEGITPSIASGWEAGRGAGRGSL